MYGGVFTLTSTGNWTNFGRDVLLTVLHFTCHFQMFLFTCCRFNREDGDAEKFQPPVTEMIRTGAELRMGDRQLDTDRQTVWLCAYSAAREKSV